MLQPYWVLADPFYMTQILVAIAALFSFHPFLFLE
jgi:hypothetical protein